MGAYLTLPVREKESRDFDGDFLSFGASSMQGWRMTQEDAHSCQVDFDRDNKTSLFAVYDGHGGAEVAQYTSMNFPNYLKATSLYEKGNVEDALEEAFLGFDATLTEESVIRQLKDLAGVENENEEVDEEVKNEAAALCEEASMPLEKVLERYGGQQASAGSLVYSLRKRQNFQSPMVRTKADKSDANEDASVSSNSAELPSATSLKAELDDVKAKLEDKLVNGFCENDANKSEAESSVSSNTEPALGHDVLSKEPESSSNKEPNAETASEVVCDSEACSASENGTDASNSGKQVICETTVETSVEEGSSQISAECKATESSATEMETPGPSSSSASSSTNVTPEDEDSEADTEEEEGDSEDEDGWNSEDAEDDSDDDEEALDGITFDEDEDDDDDDDDDGEEEGEISTMGWNEEPGADSGCTAVVALLKGRTLYVANSGDSRCVLSRGGVAMEMSADHKPEDTPEKERIVKAGGRVTCDGRVNGGLNLSRALGDHSYKRNTSLGAREQMITALPDVRSVTLCENDRFMVLACDGIWNVMSSQDVVDFVQGRLDSGVTKLSAICEEMFDFCLAPDTTGDGTGCDNMTCVIVRFNKLLDDEKDSIAEVSKKRKADSDTADSSTVKRSREELDEIECKDL